jgi:pyruvate-formate lyase
MDMRCFPDLSLEASLEGLPFAPYFPEPLSLELAISASHREHEGDHPAVRERAVLGVQFPACLQPIREGDLFAGRVYYPLVSFGPEPGGLGYACRESAIREVLKRPDISQETAAEAEEMLAYWRGRTTEARTRAAYPPELARTLPSDAYTSDSAIAFPLYRIGGTVLDYGRLLRVGLPGLIAEARERESSADAEGSTYLASTVGALGIILDSCETYARQADSLAAATGDPTRRGELVAIRQSLESIRSGPPRSLREGIQLAWIYALHSGTWNYGRADVYLGPLLAADLAGGRLDEPGALRLIEGWWRLMKAYDNQYNNRVYIGGRGRPDEPAADRFALLAMEATRRVRLNQPQLSLRFYDGQNPQLMAKALTVLGEGATFPMLYNDDVNVPAVAKAFRVSEAEAVEYHPFGCGEYVLGGRSLGSPNGVINLAKCVEAALHGGIDPWGRGRTGPVAPAPADMDSFERVWDAYAVQVEHHVEACALQERIEYEVAGREACYLFASALYADCIDRARPMLSGGVRYLGGTLETYGNVTASDSLRAIDELVFRRRTLGLGELIAACDADFRGAHNEAIRRRLLAVPKYGNDDDDADAMAQRVHNHVCHFTREQAGRAGLHSYLVVIINNWTNVVFGRTTHATPDGRRSGEPLTNGNNPAPGADRLGVTAFLNSLVKLDPGLHAGCVQNMKFSREMFGRSRPGLEALLGTYWERGGTQAMITVVSKSDLEAAMRDPDPWGHLMVRVGGFSARFIDLPRGAQEDVLRRTCHE